MTSSRRFLVTGAGGFVGGHVLAALAGREGAARAMVRRPSERALAGAPELAVADLGSAESLDAAVQGVTDIVHLAARVHRMDDDARDPLAAFREVNVEGTRRLLEAAARAGVERFLLMSSVKAMGEEGEGVFDERSDCRPTSPYGISKLESERLLFRLADEHGLRATVLRLPMVYGPGNKGNVLRLLEAACAGRRLPLGRVRNRRSMVYVGNVVDAALAALDSERSGGEVYLVADARPYGSGELYAAICRAVGREPLLRDVPLSILRLAGHVGGWGERLLGRPMPITPAMVSRLTGDLVFRCDKIRTELGFEPSVELDEGIRRTADWYRGAEQTPPAHEVGAASSRGSGSVAGDYAGR